MSCKVLAGFFVIAVIANAFAAPTTCVRDCNNPGGTHGDTVNNYGPSPPPTPPPTAGPIPAGLNCIRDCGNPNSQHGDTVNNMG